MDVLLSSRLMLRTENVRGLLRLSLVRVLGAYVVYVMVGEL